LELDFRNDVVKSFVGHNAVGIECFEDVHKEGSGLFAVPHKVLVRVVVVEDDFDIALGDLS